MSQQVLTEPSPKQSAAAPPANKERQHFDFNRITDEQFNIAADHMKLDAEASGSRICSSSAGTKIASTPNWNRK